MKGLKAYMENLRTGRNYVRFLPVIFSIVFLLLASVNNGLLGQGLPEYDEIAVKIEISGLGAFEMDALIKDEKLYLPVVNLFNFLKIKCEPSPDMDIIKGFFSSPESTYIIDRPNRQITYLDKKYEPGQNDIIRTETNVFLLSSWFGKVFGLDCNFIFRSMSVILTARSDLPLIRDCLLYTSDAADDLLCVDLGGRRTIKKKTTNFFLPAAATLKFNSLIRAARTNPH